MQDRYLVEWECVKRLINKYEKYGELFIAFDFDDTVYDYHGRGDKFPIVINTLKTLKTLPGIKLILFTAREQDKLIFAIDYCHKLGIPPDYTNESPIMNTRKPYYDLLFDDKAGLSATIEIINTFLKLRGIND